MKWGFERNVFSLMRPLYICSLPMSLTHWLTDQISSHESLFLLTSSALPPGTSLYLTGSGGRGHRTSLPVRRPAALTACVCLFSKAGQRPCPQVAYRQPLSILRRPQTLVHLCSKSSYVSQLARTKGQHPHYDVCNPLGWCKKNCSFCHCF